jgi:hypothetical protein
VENSCPGSSRSFAQLVQYASDQGLQFAYGTDFNTGVAQLGPRFGSGRCWASRADVKNRTVRQVLPEPEGETHPRASQIGTIAGTSYYTDGMAVYGWMPELTYDLVENLEAPGARQLTDSAEMYIEMWQRAYPPPGAGRTANVERIKCESDATCGTGGWCNQGVDIAQNKCEPKRRDGDACPAVGGGHACISGQCGWGHCYTPGSVALNDTCYLDAACKVGRCSAVDGVLGVCVCKADEDCGSSGLWCNGGVDLKLNRCEARKSDGESCAVVGGGHQCQGGQCAWGRCYTPGATAMGGSCYVDAACRLGKCSAVDGTRGSCVCKDDGDCGSGFWCDGGADLRKNACKAKLPSGAICGKVGELGVGHRCKSGDCKVSGVSTNLKCK